MKFLVTTVNGYGLVEDGKLTMAKRANFYGLTWNGDDVFWSWNPAHINISVIESRERGRLPLDVRGVHQILWAQDRLWITDTAHDRVAWWDGDRTGFIQLHSNDQVDNLHLNSLWEWDGCMAVMASGLEDVGFVRSLTDDWTYEIGPDLYHNFYVEDNVLYGCYKDKELQSGLFRKPLSDGPIEEFPFEPGSFARGLARDGDVFLVGCSESLPRDQRFDGGSQVLVVSNEFEVVDKIELKDTGQIRDIRLLEGDRAHNGMPFPGEAP